MSEQKFYALVHPGAPGGIVLKKPRARKQAKRAKSEEMYCVVFFPKITGIIEATVNFYGIRTTMANTPEAAKVFFMDRIAKGEKWETYHDAGHRIRKVRVIDLGDA